MPCEHMTKKMEVSEAECFSMASLFCGLLGREYIKGPCRILGSHEMLNLQRYAMLPGKGSMSG